MKNPKFIDMRSLSSECAKSVALRRINGPYQKALAVQSCLSDIRQAKECLNNLRKMKASPRKEGTLEKFTTEGALLAHAIGLYARGVGGSKSEGERGASQVGGVLPAELKDDHQHIMNLRNKALAHVYHGEDFNGAVWSEQIMLMIETENGFRPMVTTRTTQTHPEAMARLDRLIPVAEEILLKRWRKHIDKMTSLIQALISGEQFYSHEIAPAKYFNGPQILQAIIDARESGEATLFGGPTYWAANNG